MEKILKLRESGTTQLAVVVKKQPFFDSLYAMLRMYRHFQ